jgi:CspA family cold shock protein
MPTGRVKWFSLEKGFGFISNDEGEDVYLAAAALPEGVATVKPGTKLEFSIADGRRGPQALSVSVVEAPPSIATGSRGKNDDLAAMIEDTIKILDRYGNGLRSGRTSTATDGERLAKVLRGIASQIDGN